MSQMRDLEMTIIIEYAAAAHIKISMSYEEVIAAMRLPLKDTALSARQFTQL